MRFEWLVGTRYLSATRSAGTPSVITLISGGAVALGVAALIFVLAILGGFEGDLRTKILGTKAHLLVTGEHGGELADFESVLALVEDAEGVLGASPFVESDVMIASATNYSGVVLRGIDPSRVTTSSQLGDYVQEGRLEWLESPDSAVEFARGDDSHDLEDTRRLAQELLDDLDAIEADRERLQADFDELRNAPAADRIEAVQLDLMADGSGALAPPGTREGSAAPGARVGPPSLAERAAQGGPPSLAERAAQGGPPALSDVVRDRDGASRRSRSLPGILIGTELRDSLHVDVGDQIQIINPDGDLGPTGPIPRAWPYRVVGVFYTGLYEYDNTMVYMTLPSARRFLNVDPDAVTGIEVRIHDMDGCAAVGSEISAGAAALNRTDVTVATWMELNSRLFSALELEQTVIGLLLMSIVLVASFAIVCVLIMIVIQRADEIAIMRSMGATGGMIQRIFFVQGMSIGVAGTVVGLVVGLGLVSYLLFVGFPLDPNVYYIDRVPVELSGFEVVAVVAGALAISAVATLLPSVQAARLHPAEALRHE